jgi:integrase
MVRHDLPKPPGCIYARKSRLWWRGRLPGEHAIHARKITPRGSNKALLATADNLQLAREIVWSWLKQAQASGPVMTVADLVAAYLAHAAVYYRRKDGTPTGERDNIDHATRLLVALHGRLAADALDSGHLKQLQTAMIEADLSRSTINKRINIIKRMYRWAVPEKLVPASSGAAVCATLSLRLGRTAAREPRQIQPADAASVDATIACLPLRLWRMVMVHRLAGLRSTELCIMRPCDIDRTADVWIYTPAWSKEEHIGQPRIIPLGPAVQELLRPLLSRPADAYCFTPAEAMTERYQAMRLARQSAVQPSQRNRRRKSVQESYGPRYDRRSYYQAVRRGWLAARATIRALERSAEGCGDKINSGASWLVWWTPHSLRRAFLNRVRGIFGPDSARASGGHSSLDATEIYLERDLEAAKAVARQIG